MLSLVLVGDVVEAANPAPYVQFSDKDPSKVSFQVTSYRVDGKMYAGSLAWNRIKSGEVGELVEGEDVGHARSCAVAVLCRGTDETALFKEVHRTAVGTRVMVLFELQLDDRGRPRLQTQEIQVLKLPAGGRAARPSLPAQVAYDGGAEYNPTVGSGKK